MSTLMLITLIYGWMGVCLAAWLSIVCIPDAKKGLTEKLDHRIEELPNVMRGRYLAVFAMSAFIVWYADMMVLMVWALVLGTMSLYDAYLYKRKKQSYMSHFVPGILTYAIAVLAFVNLQSNGAA